VFIDRLVRMGAGAILVLTAASCGTTRDYPHESLPWHHTPAWVADLGEPVALVPERVVPAGAGATTPTEYAKPESVRHGKPRSLTAKVGEVARSITSVAATPRQSESAVAVPAHAAMQQRVDVVISGGQHRDPQSPAPAAEVASPQPSALERMFRGNLAPPVRELQQFGYDFFSSMPTGAASGSVPGSYIVLVGDEVVLTFSGSLHQVHQLSVLSDGTIAVPEIGNVVVAGHTLQELKSLITTYAQDVANRRGFELSVAMGRLSEFQVSVVGEVERPGLLDVAAGSTVLSALARAGGPKRTGSLRRVEVRRSNEVVARVDLYDFLQTGVAEGLTRLLPGDTIVVPVIGQTLAVAGYVLRPGIYEVQGETTVGQLLDLAGGLTPFSFRLHAQLETTQSGRRRSPVDLPLDEQGLATTMKNGELLIVGSLDSTQKPVVEVVGEVVRPGTFQYREGMRISDLLELVDGLTVDAYLPEAFVSRQIGEPGEITIVPDRTSVRTTRRVLLVDLEKAQRGDPDHDVLLRPLDSLRVQNRSSAVPMPTVTIMGAVRSPGTYELTAGMTVSQLVALAGNVQPEVYFDEAELLRRSYDAEQRGLQLQRYRFDLGKALAADRESNSAQDPQLANGDQIVIRALRFAQVKVWIEGEVRFPGPYAFPAGTRISDLIAAAGGVMPNADMRATVFTRVSVRDNQLNRFRHLKERTQQLYEQALEQLVMGGHANEGMAAKLSLEQTREMLGRIETSQSTGRIVIPFVNDAFPGSVYDLTLEEGDRLTVKSRQETVSVLGQVFNPGTFVAEPGVTVEDLLMRSGGITADGDNERLYVVRADGTVQGLDQGHYALRRDTRMLPGDVVLVPRRAPERTLQSQLSDVLMLARQSAEVAFLMGRLINNDADLSFTSVFQAPGYNGVDDSILNRGRK
jgi:polysaccharide biosynthesis/export protein